VLASSVPAKTAWQLDAGVTCVARLVSVTLA